MYPGSAQSDSKLCPIFPHLCPRRKLARPDLVARKVSFMQVQELCFGHLSETVTLHCINILIRP